MQKRQAKPSSSHTTKVETESSEPNQAVKSAPIELSADQLKQVSGGSPNGSWAKIAQSPNGTW